MGCKSVNTVVNEEDSQATEHVEDKFNSAIKEVKIYSKNHHKKFIVCID